MDNGQLQQATGAIKISMGCVIPEPVQGMNAATPTSVLIQF
jgi:hypothetical protein